MPRRFTPRRPRLQDVPARTITCWISGSETGIRSTLTRQAELRSRAHVDPIAHGCALHELYEQSDGLIGDSILSFDPVRRQWQQTWVTNHGSLMVITGNFSDGALILEGESHLADGRTVVQRITWKSQDDGARESAVLSKDGGKTWQPAFDVLFRKHRS